MAKLEEDGEYIKLPDTWPTEDALKSDRVTFLNVQDEKTVQLCKRAMFGNPSVYPMKNLIRGNVLVINNETFLKLEHRTGTEQDCNKIRAVFSQLGFNVIIYNNLTSSEMKKNLIRESQHNYSSHDCFILFILSHGDRGVVAGTDANAENGSNSLSIKYIRRLFSQNKFLLGKPKLFFIQACQGGQCDEGQTIDDEPNTVRHLKIGRSPIKSVQSDSPHCQTVNSRYDEDEETTDGTEIPSEADIFLSTATVEGFVAWRHATLGSSYIQAICYVFRMYAYKHDLNDLMTSVNNLVSKSAATREQFKQVATKYDTLTKKLFFFPCLHEPYVDIIHKYRQGQKEKQYLKHKFDSLSVNFAFVTQHYEHEKGQRQTLENDLKKRDETIATLKQEYEREKRQREAIENYLKIWDQANEIPDDKKLIDIGAVGESGIQNKATHKMCTVLLVGRAGSGKSSVGNAILGPDHDKPKFAPRGPSEVKRLKNEMAHNDKFVVVDCSGMGDTGSDMPGDMSSTVLSAFDALIINNSIQDGLNPVKRPAVLQRCGFDALIFVINYVPAFIKQERDAVQTIKSIFGQNVFRNWGILVFSHGDHFKTNMKERGKSFENWCKEQRGEIKSLFEEVRYRCVLFDNKTRDKDELEKQRSKLNELILTLDRPENADSIRKTYFVEDFLSIHKNRIKGWYYYLDKETKRFLAEYKSDTMSESSMTTLQARLTHYWINLKREIEEQMDYFSWEENPQVYREEIKSTKVETKGGETEAYKPMHYKEEEVQFKLNKLHYIEFRRNHQCQFDIKHEYNFKGYTDFLKTKRSDSDDIIANLDKFGKNKCILS